MKEFDVLVAGGGPAGATVALSLARQGCQVALMESTGYDSPRYGETLPPEINPVLRELKLWEAFQALGSLEAPGMISAWGDPSPAEKDFIGNVHGPGWHIDRRRFDQMLAYEAEKSGVQIYSSCRVATSERQGDCWTVGECRSRFLVDACGRNGLRIEGNTERETEDELLAIALTIAYSGQRNRDLRTCIETTADGWWYSSPLPDGTTMAMFFTDLEIYRQEGITIYDPLMAAPLTAQRVQGGRMEGSRVLHVSSSCRKILFGNNWLAVGDSASCYDPLSGRGVFKALKHGNAAASAIVSNLNGDKDTILSHAAEVRREFDEYVRQRQLYYAAENRWPERPFWKNRPKSDQN